MILTLAQLGSLFTVPGLAAAGAVCVAIPILIHLLSRFRRRTQAWGAMRFVREALQRQRRRLRMEQLLLLATRCLIVLVLGLALAGPLLTGCGERLRTAGLLQTEPRRVWLVVDDSLSSRATDSQTGAARFEALRSAALTLVDRLAANDEVRVWRASRPVGEVGAEPASTQASSKAGGERGGTLTKGEAREFLTNLRPTYGRSAVSEALAQVRSAAESAGRGDAGVSVVVLSDWSPSDLAGEGEALGEGLRLFAVRPAAEVGNAQVSHVRPWRSVLVTGGAADGGRALVPVEVGLRRFSAGEAAAGGTLTLTLLDPAGRAAGTVQRPIAWAAGQEAQVLNADIAVEAQDAGGFVVRAALEGDAGGAIREDDVRLATVALRPRLRVALVDEAVDAAAEGVPPPGRWLRVALSPGDEGAVEVTSLAVGELASRDASILAEQDAVAVVRPDLINDSTWRKLADYASAGGLVWVFPPASDEPAMWPRALRGAFGLAWRMAIEPVAIGDAERGVGVLTDRRPPAVLSLLAGDWEELWRPVRVRKWLPVYAPESDAWVALDAAAGEGAMSPALMAYHEHGEGGLLVVSAALHPGWTNLPTKPAFVPVVHEVLRGIIGGDDAPREGVVVGDAPAVQVGVGLGALRALPIDLGEIRFNASEPGGVGLERSEKGVRVAAPVTMPGVYADAPETPAVMLAVNVDASAGDTRQAAEPAVSAWLERWGPWSWLELSDPAAALRDSGEAPPSLSWPLLWALLGLVVLETVLARVFSHARALHHRGLTAALVERLKRFHVAHHENEADTRPSERGRAA